MQNKFQERTFHFCRCSVHIFQFSKTLQPSSFSFFLLFSVCALRAPLGNFVQVDFQAYSFYFFFLYFVRIHFAFNDGGECFGSFATEVSSARKRGNVYIYTHLLRADFCVLTSWEVSPQRNNRKCILTSSFLFLALLSTKSCSKKCCHLFCFSLSNRVCDMS